MQAWIEELKWEQTIREERKAAYKEAYQEAYHEAEEKTAIANAKLLIADGRYALEEVSKLLNIPEDTLREVTAIKEELKTENY